MITTAGAWTTALKDELKHAEYMKENQRPLKKFWYSRIRDIKRSIKENEALPVDQKIVLGKIETPEEMEIVFGKSNQ